MSLCRFLFFQYCYVLFARNTCGTTRGVGWDISFCSNMENPTLEDFILGLFGFMHYAWGAKNTTREAPQEIRAIPWGNPALKEGGLR